MGGGTPRAAQKNIAKSKNRKTSKEEHAIRLSTFSSSSFSTWSSVILIHYSTEYLSPGAQNIKGAIHSSRLTNASYPAMMTVCYSDSSII